MVCAASKPASFSVPGPAAAAAWSSVTCGSALSARLRSSTAKMRGSASTDTTRPEGPTRSAARKLK